MNLLTIDELRELTEVAVTTKNIMVPAECGEINDHYYSFLYWLAKRLEPRLYIELGTGREAKSAAHFALGSPLTKVIGIDFDPPTFTPYPNIEWWKGDTLKMRDRVAALSVAIDCLFIDSTHESEHAQIEFDLYWPLLRLGGVLLLDDVGMDGMRTFWAGVPEPKLYHSELHSTCGFGMAVKNG